MLSNRSCWTYPEWKRSWSRRICLVWKWDSLSSNCSFLKNRFCVCVEMMMLFIRARIRWMNVEEFFFKISWMKKKKKKQKKAFLRVSKLKLTFFILKMSFSCWFCIIAERLMIMLRCQDQIVEYKERKWQTLSEFESLRRRTLQNKCRRDVSEAISEFAIHLTQSYSLYQTSTKSITMDGKDMRQRRTKGNAILPRSRLRIFQFFVIWFIFQHC